MHSFRSNTLAYRITVSPLLVRNGKKAGPVENYDRIERAAYSWKQYSIQVQGRTVTHRKSLFLQPSVRIIARSYNLYRSQCLWNLCAKVHIQTSGWRRPLTIALKMHASVLVSLRGKVHPNTKPEADFSKFPTRVARRAYPTNGLNDEPRDVPFKVSGIRLPKKNIDEWTGGGISLSSPVCVLHVSPNVDAYKVFIHHAKCKIFASCDK